MSRKKKKIEIIDQELTPTVLAKVEEKKVNLIGLIILFIIFGTVVYFLPNISSYVNSFFHPVVTDPKPSTPSDNPGGDDEQPELEHFLYSNKLVIEVNSLFSLNSFNVSNNKLNFTINNSNGISLKMEKYKYFLEIYNSDDTLLQRIQFKDIVVGASSSSNLSYDLVDSNVSYFILREIPVEEYPAYVAPMDTNKKGTLVCRKGYEQINYLLENNKLYSIEDIYTVSNTDANYASLWSTYLSLASTYNSLTGVTSEVVTSDTELKFSTIIDLSVNNSVNINKIIYAKDTDAKVMRFELVSNGYKCD